MDRPPFCFRLLDDKKFRNRKRVEIEIDYSNKKEFGEFGKNIDRSKIVKILAATGL